MVAEFARGPRVGMLRCGKINCMNSDSESCAESAWLWASPGIAGIINWPHVKMVRSSLGDGIFKCWTYRRKLQMHAIIFRCLSGKELY